jgi:hypothetical protein
MVTLIGTRCVATVGDGCAGRERAPAAAEKYVSMAHAAAKLGHDPLARLDVVLGTPAPGGGASGDSGASTHGPAPATRAGRAAAAMALRALQVVVLAGVEVGERSGNGQGAEGVLRRVLRTVRAHEGCAEVAQAGHAVLSALALLADGELDAAQLSRVDPAAVTRFLAWEQDRQLQRQRAKALLRRLRGRHAAAALDRWRQWHQQKLGLRRMLARWMRQELSGAMRRWAAASAAARTLQQAEDLVEASRARDVGEWPTTLQLAKSLAAACAGGLVGIEGAQGEGRAPLAQQAVLFGVERSLPVAGGWPFLAPRYIVFSRFDWNLPML